MFILFFDVSVILLVKIKQTAAAATTTICREMVNRMSMMGAHCHDFMPLPSSQSQLLLCLFAKWRRLLICFMFHV